MNATVMMVDDDYEIGQSLKVYLERFGYEVAVYHHPEDALHAFRPGKFDVIILDIMLPGMDGFEFCRRIRRVSQIPIVMLTARGEVTDRIVGIELGADDYLAKPFEPRELEVRIQAILRRTKHHDYDSALNFGKLAVDLTKQIATVEGQELDLSTAEFKVLEAFVRSPGKTFTRDQLIDQLHGSDWASFERSIDVLVSRLRQKLGDHPKKPIYIRTVWGTGYRFIGGGL